MTSSDEPSGDERVKRWKYLTSSTKDFQLVSIRVIKSSIFAPQLIKFDRTNAIVGLHGAGKSFLLKVIEVCFGYGYSFDYYPPFVIVDKYGPRSSVPVHTGVMDITVKTPKGLVSLTVDLSRPAKERREAWEKVYENSFEACYIDPRTASSMHNYMFDHHDFTSAPTKADRIYNLSKEERKDILNVLGRSYDEISIRSALIEDNENDQLFLPRISAVINNKTFDNTAMSFAELWVYAAHWFLEDQIHRGGLALLDEPETSLAPRGQRPFIDHIARLAVRNHLQLIIATHSPKILSRFPLANIRICSPEDDGIHVRVPKDLHQMRESIGIDTPIRGIALVEDELAKQLLEGIFALYDTALTREVDIIVVDGEANVIKALTLLKSQNRLMCVGVLDADQLGKDSASAKHGVRERVFYLPGSMKPEDELLSSAARDAQWISGIIGASTADVTMAISSSRDLDHQYQIGSMARFLGRSESAITPILASAWLRRPEIAREAERLANAVRGALPDR